MPGPEFFQTRMGQVFYEGTMPALVRELKKLNENLERNGDLFLYGVPKKMIKEAMAKIEAPKPEGTPPGWHTDLIKNLAREAERSGEAAGRLVGEHLIDLGEDHTNSHKSDELKHVRTVVAELENIEQWAKSIRTKLEQEL